MSSVKKKGIRMKRRTFVILILSVCVIAIGAETVLLVHSFTKKNKGKTPGEVTKEPDKVVTDITVTPSATPTGGAKEETRTIYVKVKEETYQSTEKTPDGAYAEPKLYSRVEYSYDELGRLARKELSYYGEERRDYHSSYIYEPSGLITETQTVYFDPDGNPEKTETGRTYELPYGHTVSDSNGSNVTLTYDENGYWKKIVCVNPREEAEFTFDAEGRIEKASYIYYQGQSDDMEIAFEDEYAYREDGTVIRTRRSKDLEVYSGRITNYDIKTYKDGRLLKQETYSDEADSIRWVYDYEYTSAGRWENLDVINDPVGGRGSKSFALDTGESNPPQISSWDASFYDNYRFETDRDGNALAIYGIAGSEEHKLAYVEYDDNGRPVHYYHISRWDEEDIRYQYDDAGNLTEIFTTDESDRSYQSKTTITYEAIQVPLN